MFSFFTQLKRLERQRIKSLEGCSYGELKDFLSEPLLPLKQNIEEQELLAIDLETSGLDPKSDFILSIGGVNIRGGRIDLSTAFHHLIVTDKRLDARNVSVHGIRDQDLKSGLTLEAALIDLLKRAKGKHLLVHFAEIERNFLKAAYLKVFATHIPFQFVDTFEISKRLLKQKEIPLCQAHLSLGGMRTRQNLPTFEPHNALNDAIATAELYLTFKKI